MNDYPNDETLERITSWPYTDFDGLMRYVKEEWVESQGWFENRASKIEPCFGSRAPDDDGHWWCCATGGWSGNEDLIGALMANYIFWACCWRASVRGGYYEFHAEPTTNDREA